MIWKNQGFYVTLQKAEKTIYQTLYQYETFPPSGRRGGRARILRQ